MRSLPHLRGEGRREIVEDIRATETLGADINVRFCLYMQPATAIDLSIVQPLCGASFYHVFPVLCDSELYSIVTCILLLYREGFILDRH